MSNNSKAMQQIFSRDPRAYPGGRDSLGSTTNRHLQLQGHLTEPLLCLRLERLNNSRNVESKDTGNPLTGMKSVAAEPDEETWHSHARYTDYAFDDLRKAAEFLL